MLKKKKKSRLAQGSIKLPSITISLSAGRPRKNLKNLYISTSRNYINCVMHLSKIRQGVQGSD